MAYVDVATLAVAARTPGDLQGKIEIAFLKQAVTRLTAIATSDPLKERLAAIEIINGATLPSWRLLVLGLIDIAGQLSNATDAQIDTQVQTAWTHICNARRLVDRG